MECGSRFVKHAPIAKVGVSGNRHARCAALGSTACIGDTGEAVWNPRYAVKSRGRRASTVWSTVANAMCVAEPEIVQSGWAESMRFADGDCVIGIPTSLTSGESRIDVVVVTHAKFCVCGRKDMVGLIQVPVETRVEAVY